MKYLLVAAGLILASCKKEVPQDAPVEQQAETVPVPEEKDNLRLKELTNRFREQKEQMEAKLAKATPEEANRLFEDYVKSNGDILNKINTLEQRLLEDYYHFFYDNDGAPVKVHDTLVEKTVLLKNAGLQFSDIGEGMTEISPQPDFYLRIFKNYVTSDYKEFLALQASDDKELWSSDAAVAIPWPELGKRVINWENFTKKYPSSPLYPEALFTYRMYRHSYLFGQDNTSTFEYNETTLYPEMKTEFERFVKQYPNSQATKLVQQMLDHNGQGFEGLRAQFQKELDTAYHAFYQE